MLATALGDVQRITHVVLYWCWEITKIFKTCTNPDYRLERRVSHGNPNYSDITIIGQWPGAALRGNQKVRVVANYN